MYCCPSYTDGVDNSMIDTFEQRYYRITKLLLWVLGQWPTHDDRRYIVREGCVTLALMSFLFTQFSKVATCREDLEIIMNVIPSMTTFLTTTVKYYTFVLKRKTMKGLLSRMHSDWDNLMTNEEILIVEKYAEEVKLYTKIYAILIFSTLALYMFVPLLPTLLDVLIPLNESRPRLKLVEAEYFVDDDEYYYSILCHQFVTLTVAVTVIVAADTMYIAYTLHACAMFAIVGHHLEHTLYSYDKHSGDETASANKNITVRQHIFRCIDHHLKAIEFAGMIESSFTVSLFIQSFNNVAALSCTLMQVLVFMNDTGDAVRYGLFVGAQLVHMLIHTFPGQRLMDQSLQVSINLYGGEWYTIPAKSQKLLLLIMRRSMEPCCITAGKVMVLSLMSFSSIVQTSVSYFTMLRSTQ